MAISYVIIIGQNLTLHFVLNKQHFLSYFHSYLSHSPEKDVISANVQFAIDGSKFFRKLEDALWYFEKLNRELDEKAEKDNGISHK